jgi:chaperonin GroES
LDELDALPPEAEADEEARPENPSSLEKLMLLANAEGDISRAFSDKDLAKLGADVVADYERDDSDRQEWKDVALRALSLAAQEKAGDKVYPWEKASNVRYPMLTVACLQFNARSYPAIVKGDEAVSVKVVGRDTGLPMIGPDGQPMAQAPDGQKMTATMALQLPPEMQEQLQPVWIKQPGVKTSRAQRVREYMNTTLFYRIEGWEEDTDQLLMQLPIVGCVFRKVCYADGEFHIRMVSALNIVAPAKARDVKTTPRLTEEIPDVFPYQIAEKMALGIYRTVDLQPESDDDQAPRMLLEQHRLMDMDGDGISEPYIITVDKATSEILRIESNFSAEEALQAGGRVKKLSTYYVKYDFFPHPKGLFYGIGFGHLLEPLVEVVNTAINQLNDAATAANAGGGFIASGVRLQGNSSAVRFKPGEYKTVNGVTGAQLREAIYERTFPTPSPVTFQLLELMLGAARDITSVKDVVTGEASNQGQVGTTLALIEQGLAVFTAIYKRVYRSLREEFTLLYDGMSRWGGKAMQADYIETLDDPDADFAADFNARDMDIRPVSDPTSVTKMQKMARAQFLMGFIGMGLDDNEIRRRVLEAADIEDIDALFPKEPPQPDPKLMAEAEDKMASAGLKQAQTEKTQVETALLPAVKGFEMGMKDAGTDAGGVPGMAGEPGQPMGVPGGQPGF